VTTWKGAVSPILPTDVPFCMHDAFRSQVPYRACLPPVAQLPWKCAFRAVLAAGMVRGYVRREGSPESKSHFSSNLHILVYNRDILHSRGVPRTATFDIPGKGSRPEWRVSRPIPCIDTCPSSYQHIFDTSLNYILQGDLSPGGEMKWRHARKRGSIHVCPGFKK
jgi:hypothetical protein